MNKENRNLLVNSVVVLLIAVLFIFIYAVFIPTTKADKIFNKKINLEKTELTDNIKIIKEKYIAKSGSNEVGIVYLVETTNGYGKLEFYVGIDKDELVSVEMITINQSSFAVKGLNNFVKKEFKNLTKKEVEDLKIYSVADLDTSAGATASESPQDLKTAVIEVINFHDNVVSEDPIELIYGKGAVATLDDSFTGNELVLIKEDIYLEDAYLGSLYLLKGTGIYHQTNEDSLEYKVALDKDLNILGFIEIEYNHSSGSFKAHATGFLNKLIDTNLLEFEDLDEQTNATNSTNLLTDMLITLKEVLQ